MRILLVRPKPPKETIGLQNVMICEPLELEYLYAALKKEEHEVQIIDMILEKKDILYFIKEFKPDVVGMTGYITHVGIIKEYSKKIKELDKEIKTIVGGVHAEVVPEDFKDENIDYIIAANGIKTLKNIINGIENKIGKSEIEGIYEGIKVQKEMEFNYCFPDRSSVSKYRDKYYYMFHNPCALIKTSYGCPYNCKFCFCRSITDGKYSSRPMESVIEELLGIKEKEIYIVDDDFLFNKEKLHKFCDLIEEYKLDKKFLVYGRADFIADNEDLMKRLSKNGLRAVIVGLESSNEEELKKYNKKTNNEINEKAVEVLQKYNIECYATLILGIDWNKKDFDNLYKWIKRLDIHFVNLQPFTPMPGTSMLKEYEDTLIIKREEFEKWDLAHLVVKPSKMSVRYYYFNIILLYYKCVMRPKNILYIVKKYGLKESLKMSIGSSAITIQYFRKVILGK